MSKNTPYIIGGGVAGVAIISIISIMVLTGSEPELTVPMEVIEEDKIKVFASFFPYYEFARNVAGDHAIVEQYLPSGVEAHDWEPRPQEIQSLKDADVFVYNGLGMESYVDNIIDSGEFDNVIFVTAAKGVETIKPDEGHEDTHAEEFGEEIEHVIEEFEHDHIDASQAFANIEEILHEHEGDGHDHGNETIEKIEEILHEIEEGNLSAEEGMEEIHHTVLEIGEGHEGDRHDGEHEGDRHEEEHDEDRHEGEEHEGEGHHGHDHDYEFDPHIWLDPILVKQQVNNIRDGLIMADPQNQEHYEQNAQKYNEKLDALDMKIKSSLTSCKKDTFVPFHNAFTYLGERYGINVMALGGLAPDAEATGAEIAEFIDFVKDNDIKIIFSEELVDPRLAQVIADEAGAEVLLFSPIEALAPEEVGKNVTYLDKMEQNLDALKVALECQ